VATLGGPYELEVAAEFELPQYSAKVAMLSGGAAVIELIEYTDRRLADERLDGQEMRLDHVAFLVDDIDSATERLRAAGVSFCAADGSPTDAPLEIGGAKHLLTIPVADLGLRVQLVERPP
jgi:hypothetical protein